MIRRIAAALRAFWAADFGASVAPAIAGRGRTGGA